MAAERLCTTCGHTGDPKSETPGSLLIEIVMWCAFLVPGIIYTLWRRSAARDVCAKCGGSTLIPLDSPVARQIAQSLPAQASASIEPARRPSKAATSLGHTLGRAVGRMLGR